MVQKGKLGPCLVLYVLLTFISLVFPTARRFVVSAEMGGSIAQNYASAAFMISLWKRRIHVSMPPLALCRSVCLPRSHTHARTHARARAHTHTHAYIHTRMHAYMHT